MLTGAVFSQHRYALEQAVEKLENGNFLYNDKPTGAVVGHNHLGVRISGTNDRQDPNSPFALGFSKNG